MIARLAVIGICGLALVGCDPARNDNLFAYEGLFYAPKLAFDRADRAAFVVRVVQFEQGLEGAREAARYEATKHCINYLGSSEAIWDISPDAPKDALRIVDGALVFAGRCRG